MEPAAILPRALCPCGSGLSRARCCSLDLSSLGAPEAHRHLLPLEEAAAAARQGGDLEEAEALALDVLELAPSRIRALGVLYEIRKSQGRPDACAALVQRIVRLTPNNFWAINELTLLLLRRGDVDGAVRHARDAVRLAPDNAQSHYLLGLALTQGHRPVIGEHHLRRALELSQNRDPALLANLALSLKNQGKMQEARTLYGEALAGDPDNLHTLMGFARLEEADRDLPAALALIDLVQALDPDNPHARLLRAVVLARMGNNQAALNLLVGVEETNPEVGAGELIEKGRLLDRMGRHGEAFAAFDAGKARLRERTGLAYRDDAAKEALARRRRFFTAKRLAGLPRASRREDVAQPVFVVGFPRSGTTLLEQTLSAHSRIAAGDELPFLSELVELMPRLLDSPLLYPDALAELWMGDHRDDLDAVRDHYLRKAAQHGLAPEGVRWFTDKMPLNETELGLIGLVFPKSPILHVTRHPLDVMVSVHSTLLTHGHFCGYALETAALHYVRVMDLVDHYRSQMDLRYLNVRYESMVERQEATVRDVLAFIGEDFEPGCLSFHENRRFARTASYAQVTEKLYDRSRYRYRAYLRELEPIIPILRPVIDRFGYAIEE